MKIQNISTSRDKNIKKNILSSFVLKFGGMAISFVVIPITLNFLGVEEYGIWAAILSILSWIAYFDIGLGNGLRNKLAKSISENNRKEAREYIATTYFAISIIVSIILIISFIVIPILNWNSIFKVQSILNGTLKNVMTITIMFTLINFMLSIYNQMFYAIQKSAFTGLGQLINNILILISILLIRNFTSGNLIIMAYIYGISMIITSCLLTYILFKSNKYLIPNFKDIKISKVRDVTEIGLKFFVIQICALIIFTTDNMIIIQTLGVEYVTPYTLVQKLFSIITIVFGMIIAPLWSAYTDAYHREDYKWIIKVIKKMNMIFGISIIVCIILVSLSPIIFKVWVGNKVEIPRLLVILMAVYTLISIWNNIYVYFLNGISRVKYSMYTSIIGAIINIPLSVMLAEKIGLAGIILGTTCSLSLAAIQAPIETYLILRKKESKGDMKNEGSVS